MHHMTRSIVALAIIFASLFSRSTIALLGDEPMVKLVVRQAIPTSMKTSEDGRPL